MSAYLGRRRTCPDTAARLRRLIAALAAVTCGLLAWVGAVPAASAAIIPVPQDGPYGPALATAGSTTRVITVGAMPGWQIALIAVAAALVTAAAAVLLDRARGRPPGRLHHRMTPSQPGPDTARPWVTATVQARPGCPARVRHPSPHDGPAPEHPHLRPRKASAEGQRPHRADIARR